MSESVNRIRFYGDHACWWWIFGIGQVENHWAYQTSAPRQSGALAGYTNNGSVAAKVEQLNVAIHRAGCTWSR